MEAAVKPESSYALPDFSARPINFAAPIHSNRYFKPIVTELCRRYAYRADLRRLLKVGPYMIDDIGLAREDAIRESEKPIWQP